MASTLELFLFSQMTQWQAAWSPYTPAWTSSGTAPAIGNGSVTGFYSKIGHLVTARILIASGSTTTFGTGSYSVTLPLTAAVTSAAANAFVHSGTWTLSSAGITFYTCNAVITQNSPGTVIGIVNGSGNFMGATNPASLSGGNCLLQATITYESTT